MEIISSFVISVHEQSQVGEARRRVARLASVVGFDEQETGKLSIVASELATNLVKHTQDGGSLVVQEYLPEQSIDILSLNKQPGALHPEQWLKDGYSTAKTLGTGLGAVSRLSHEFDLYSDVKTGTVISAKLISGKRAQPSFDVGIVSVPKPEEVVCGDSWYIDQDQGNLSVIVADGLGHGVEARDASRIACDIFKQQPFANPVEMIERIHKGLKNTRGAAVSIVHIIPGSNKVAYAGVGNISVSIETDDITRKHLVPDNGTAGFNLRKVRLTETEWTGNAMVIIHSDGCASSWNLNNYPGVRQKSAAVVAGCLFRDYGKAHDDCTVIAIQPNRRASLATVAPV